jgi:hypothetical protein
MAYPADNSSSNVATVAIVVLVLVAIIAGYLLFFRGGTTAPATPTGPDIEINLGGGGDGGGAN